MTVRDELQARALFQERYGNSPSPTARQIELTTQFAEKATQRSQDLVKLSAEHQAEMTKWFDETVAETARTAKKAA